MAIFYNPNRKKGLFYIPSGATGGERLSIEYSAARFCENGVDPIAGITGETGGTFSSTTGLVFISTSTGQVDLSASTIGTYIVTYTAPSSETATTSISVDSIPVVSAGSDVAICNGENTILTASGATTYSWSTGQTGASITVDPTTDTTYTVTGFNGACSDTDSVDVTVYALPTVSITGTLTYCAGASTTLDAGSFVSYLWSNGETTQTISATTGNYTVTVTDSNGCSNTSAQVTVTELALPTVAISGTLSYCAGSNTTLTATDGLSSYLWSSGETTQSITATAGSYTVTGTDANGCSTTSSSVTVTETPLDNAAFAYSASSYEPTDSDPTPTITGLTGGTFSGTTGLVINSTTGEIDLSASTVASHTITYDTTSSGSSVCPNTSTQTVDIALAGISNVYSMRLDGASSERINISSVISSISSSSTGSISFWVKPESSSIGDWHEVISFASNTANTSYLIFYKSNTQKGYLQFRSGGSQIFQLETNSAVFSANTWANVVITQNGTEPEIYINGSKPAQTFLSSADKTYWWPNITSFNTANINAMIWSNGTQVESFGVGVINVDEVALWNTALTSTQVQSIYDATGTNLTKDLTTVSGSNLIYWNRMGD